MPLRGVEGRGCLPREKRSISAPSRIGQPAKVSTPDRFTPSFRGEAKPLMKPICGSVKQVGVSAPAQRRLASLKAVPQAFTFEISPSLAPSRPSQAAMT